MSSRVSPTAANDALRTDTFAVTFGMAARAAAIEETRPSSRPRGIEMFGPPTWLKSGSKFRPVLLEINIFWTVAVVYSVRVEQRMNFRQSECSWKSNRSNILEAYLISNMRRPIAPSRALLRRVIPTRLSINCSMLTQRTSAESSCPLSNASML
jgi:hypothetical protein